MAFIILIFVMISTLILLRHIESTQRSESGKLKSAINLIRIAHTTHTLSKQEHSTNPYSKLLSTFLRPLVLDLKCDIDGLDNIFTCSTIEEIYISEHTRLIQTSIVRAAMYLLVLVVLTFYYLQSIQNTNAILIQAQLSWVYLSFFILYMGGALALARTPTVNSENCLKKLMPKFLPINPTIDSLRIPSLIEQKALRDAHESKLRFQIEKHPKTLQSRLSVLDLMFVGALGIASFLATSL